MPMFYVYYREKNKQQGNVLFGGKPVEAVDETSAKVKAINAHPALRMHRLFALPARSSILALTQDSVTAKIVTEHVEGMSPEEIKALLQPKPEVTDEP